MQRRQLTNTRKFSSETSPSPSSTGWCLSRRCLLRLIDANGFGHSTVLRNVKDICAGHCTRRLSRKRKLVQPYQDTTQLVFIVCIANACRRINGNGKVEMHLPKSFVLAFCGQQIEPLVQQALRRGGAYQCTVTVELRKDILEANAH